MTFIKTSLGTFLQPLSCLKFLKTKLATTFLTIYNLSQTKIINCSNFKGKPQTNVPSIPTQLTGQKFCKFVLDNPFLYLFPSGLASHYTLSRIDWGITVMNSLFSFFFSIKGPWFFKISILVSYLYVSFTLGFACGIGVFYLHGFITNITGFLALFALELQSMYSSAEPYILDFFSPLAVLGKSINQAMANLAFDIYCLVTSVIVNSSSLVLSLVLYKFQRHLSKALFKMVLTKVVTALNSPLPSQQHKVEKIRDMSRTYEAEEVPSKDIAENLEFCTLGEQGESPLFAIALVMLLFIKVGLATSGDIIVNQSPALPFLNPIITLHFPNLCWGEILFFIFWLIFYFFLIRKHKKKIYYRSKFI